MKLKMIMKALIKGAETMLVLWSIGACVGAGFRAGEKADDFFDECYWDFVKSRRVRRCEKKLDKLSKKEKLSDKDREVQKKCIDEILAWGRINSQEEATLGTKIVGGFNIIHHKDEEEKES